MEGTPRKERLPATPCDFALQLPLNWEQQGGLDALREARVLFKKDAVPLTRQATNRCKYCKSFRHRAVYQERLGAVGRHVYSLSATSFLFLERLLQKPDLAQTSQHDTSQYFFENTLNWVNYMSMVRHANIYGYRHDN